MIIKGKVWKFGDNIDTDTIIPGRYLRTFNLDELASHAMEPIRPEFPKKVKKGDIIVAGNNFGCGSSREQAAKVLKHLGISAIVAKSFARIFFRNSINIGLPAIISNVNASDGDLLEIKLEEGIIHNVTTGKVFKAKPYNKFILDILKAGGIIQYLKRNQHSFLNEE